MVSKKIKAGYESGFIHTIKPRRLKDLPKRKVFHLYRYCNDYESGNWQLRGQTVELNKYVDGTLTFTSGGSILMHDRNDSHTLLCNTLKYDALLSHRWGLRYVCV